MSALRASSVPRLFELSYPQAPKGHVALRSGDSQRERIRKCRAHLARQPTFQFTCLVALQKTGSNTVGGETPSMLGERDQVFVDIGVHGALSWVSTPRPACAGRVLASLVGWRAYFAYLRKSGLRFSFSALTPSRDS